MKLATRTRRTSTPAKTPEMAVDQLRRMLALLSIVADGEPHKLVDLALDLDVDVATVLDDLHTVVDRYSRHEGFVEKVELYLTDDQAQLVSTHFMRPMRLTPAEVQALEIGLSMLRLERTPEVHATIDRARDRLRAAQTNVRIEAPSGVREELYYGAPRLTEQQAKHLELVRLAILRDRKLTIRYRKANDSEGGERTVSPYMVLRSAEKFFVVAYCDVADALRLFRLDRIEEVNVLYLPRSEGQNVTLDGLDGLERWFIRHADTRLAVQYSPRIARWIEEREAVERTQDGSVVATYLLGDKDWAIRHVLQYGPEAEAVAPGDVRDCVIICLQKMSGISEQTVSAPSIPGGLRESL